MKGRGVSVPDLRMADQQNPQADEQAAADAQGEQLEAAMPETTAGVEPEAAIAAQADPNEPSSDEAAASDETPVTAEADDASLLDRVKDAAATVAEKVRDAAETVVETVSERAGDAVEAARERIAGDTDAPTAEASTDTAAETDTPSLVERAQGAVAAAAAAVTDRATSAVEAVRERFSSDDDRRGGDGAPSGFGYTGREAHETVKLADLDAREGGPSKQQRDRLAAMMESSFTAVPEHDIVKGRVVTVGDKDVVIDIGFKSDGIIARNEFSGVELEPGQDVEVYVERRENYQGQLVLSKTKADSTLRWRRIEEAFQGETILEGEITKRIKGGMIVELFDGVEAFLPGSQIDVRPVRDFDAYLGRRMEFKIVKLNEANQNIVVSHKALIEQDLASQRQSILETMEPGQVLEGIVKNITDFGVFVDLGGVDGLLHITDLSWGRVQHPSEVVESEQKLNVVVLDYDRDRQRISLGLKQLQPHPWETIHDKYAIGQEVEGKVVSITDYGAFVELEKGIEGLVHISEMSWTEHVKHPSQVVSLGQVVRVKILNIDDDTKKISLGMKQLQPDPWGGIAARYPVGTQLHGKVRNITAFGVFVEIEPGIDGLVHISDLSWTKKVRHPGEVVKKGQDLDVLVLGIDERNRRISLGHKQVQTDPWQQFATVYAEGTETEATVVRVHDRGLDVELPLEVEAFVPASELKKPGHPADNYREGEKLDGLFVLRFDRNGKEIVLSETARERQATRSAADAERAAKRAERDEERRGVAEYQRGQAASGPATLGELSGLAALRDRLAAEEQGEGSDES